MKKKQVRKKKTHCINDHIYDEQNSYYNKLGTRQCKKCAYERGIKSYKDNAINKVESVRKYALKNPNKVREWEQARKLRKYNLDIKEYNEILESQNNTCAICKKECKSGRSLAIDHNHNTGKVRGLLCMNCNNGLGRFNDDIELLMNSINYLKND